VLWPLGLDTLLSSALRIQQHPQMHSHDGRVVVYYGRLEVCHPFGPGSSLSARLNRNVVVQNGDDCDGRRRVHMCMDAGTSAPSGTS